jgi:hypothetical protein
MTKTEFNEMVVNKIGRNWKQTYGPNDVSLRYEVTTRIKETDAFQIIKNNLIQEPVITLGYDSEWVYRLEVGEADEGLDIAQDVALNVYKVHNLTLEHCFRAYLEMDSEAHLIEQIVEKIKELRAFTRTFRGQHVAYRV